MKKALGLILIVIFFTVGSSVRLSGITVKQSEWRGKEYPQGRNLTPKNNDSDKNKSNRKDPCDANKPDKGKEKSESSEKNKNANSGKDYQKQLKALESQMASEQEKFAARKVQLGKIMDEADRKGDTKRADLAKNVLAKEQQQYEQKKQQLEEKRQKLIELIRQESDKDAKESTKKKSKPSNDPNAEKTTPD